MGFVMILSGTVEVPSLESSPGGGLSADIAHAGQISVLGDDCSIEEALVRSARLAQCGARGHILEGATRIAKLWTIL